MHSIVDNISPPFQSEIPRFPIDIDYKTITEVVNQYNSGAGDERLKFVISRLVQHLHDFAREVSLTSEEWMEGIRFLTWVGQISSDIRQEFILLSDVMGLSTLVDSMNNVKPDNATQATVLGPFFTDDARQVEVGDSIVSDRNMQVGDPMFVTGRILDTDGRPIPKARIETWETDPTGHYDNQYPDRKEPDCRGRLFSAADGSYSYRAIRPVAYPIPSDGPVGMLLKKLGRHVYRPAHLHMMIEAEGYETLVTALYPEGDEYLYSDAVFGVKSKLVCSLKTITDEERVRDLGFKKGPVQLLEWDFVLVTKEQAKREREKVVQYLSSKPSS
ncbi:intradiol ring-cleavage dioxygenase [Violaceomyces palustris]|uniref:Intradiol ring-cleavage dioxygenase n=1 Tax=Violaceomyces palustris TaxID=1673888 RepID=A0ACD0P7A5_9BASI|nr:intradiol ring-cleavage dioxygenase [Violaceomyces palustris]